MKNKPPRKPRPRTRVLVVLSSNGFVELFAGKDVDFHVAQRLHVETIEAERMVDEYLTNALPKQYRDLFFPGKLRATGLVSSVAPGKEIEARYQLSILKGLREVRDEQAAENIPVAIQRRMVQKHD